MKDINFGWREGAKNNRIMTAVGVMSILSIFGYNIGPHFDRDTYIATVTDKERVVDGDSSKNIVSTRLEGGC